MLTNQRAVAYFTDTANDFKRRSLLLVASAATCFIVGAFTKGARKDYAETMAELKEVIAEEGLAMAQMYKYIGLARQLVISLTKDTPAGEINDVIDGVLNAKTPQAAAKEITGWMDSTGHIKSLDSLGAFLGGKYQRSASPPDGTNNGEDTDADSDDATANGERTTRARHIPVTATSEEIAAAIVEPVEGRDTLTIWTEVVTSINDAELLRSMITVAEERLDTLLEDALPKRGRKAQKGRTARKQFDLEQRQSA